MTSRWAPTGRVGAAVLAALLLCGASLGCAGEGDGHDAGPGAARPPTAAAGEPGPDGGATSASGAGGEGAAAATARPTDGAPSTSAPLVAPGSGNGAPAGAGSSDGRAPGGTAAGGGNAAGGTSAPAGTVAGAGALQSSDGRRPSRVPATSFDASTGTCRTPLRAEPDGDRPRYRVTARVAPEEGVVEGELSVRFVADLPVDRLVFRLWPNTARNVAGGSHLDVSDLAVEGGSTFVDQPDPTTVEIGLSAPVAAGVGLRATLRYRLVVGGAVRDRIAKGPGWLRLGSFLPLLAWEPGIGWAREPPSSGFAEAATSPAADYDVAVTVPDGYQVLGPAQPAAGGHWTVMAARDVAFSIGRFRTASQIVAAPGPVTVTVGVEASLADDESAYLDRVADALADTARRFGPYPWPTLTVALTPELNGGIEFPAHIMQGPGSIGRTTPHEVAHQWFYGLVGNNQGRDPVLDEGLATWAEARHDGTLDAVVASPIEPGAAGEAGEPMTYWEDRLDAYYAGVYLQGAQALAALGSPAAVDCALAGYVAVNAFRLADQGDLVAALAAVFPAAADVLGAYGVRRR